MSMDEDKAKVVPAMTTHERQEMLNLQEQGELPENIDRSTDLYFRFLLGTPARGRLLRAKIGRAHVLTPVTTVSRMPSSA